MSERLEIRLFESHSIGCMDMGDEFVLCTDSQECRHIKLDTIGKLLLARRFDTSEEGETLRKMSENDIRRKVGEWNDSFFVSVADGDYGTIIGFHGCVPYNDKAGRVLWGTVKLTEEYCKEYAEIIGK